VLIATFYNNDSGSVARASRLRQQASESSSPRCVESMIAAVPPDLTAARETPVVIARELPKRAVDAGRINGVLCYPFHRGNESCGSGASVSPVGEA
jgi:hypothetical protein